MLGYFLHRKITFRDFKKVGVAIYANGIENLKNIYSKIGHYPDFIHVDIVDESMKSNAEKVETYRLETMRAYWPNTQIQTHIMSYKPEKWLDDVIIHSDVVYIHAECKKNFDLYIKKIKDKGKKAGIALTMATKPEKIIHLLKMVDYVLLLTIRIPGSSGQKFDSEGFERIKYVNNLPFRSNFTLCVDGGINENIVKMIDADNIVSGSSVLKSLNPKSKIMHLQTAGRYETI
jgi:Pentose-5-phosphate-3-epimerase